MEVFIELTRNCNMSCTHCLRGEPQNRYMPDHIISAALRLSDGYIGIGGGESLSTSKLIRNLHHLILTTPGVYIDSLFIVTNGLGIMRSSRILEVLGSMAIDEIFLAVSTDKWHEPGADIRLSHIKDEASMYASNIFVHSHGPIYDEQILHMGRGTNLNYKELVIESETPMLYVDVTGNVWGSCDLSYTFMAKYKNSALCFGNVLTHTEEQIYANMDLLNLYLEENDPVGITEFYIPEKLETKLTQDKIKTLCKIH